MKKIITTIIASYLVLQSISAQISITSGSAYKVGQYYTVQTCSTSNITLSAAGANVNVDYSAAIASGSSTAVNFVAPSTTPYGSSFPNANVAFSAVTSQGNTAYTYYNSSASKLELLGVANASITLYYANAQLVYNMPTNFNDTYKDTARSVYFSNGVEGRRTIYTTSLADAYGNITTPKGTYPYLRFKSTQTIVDSFFLNGMLANLSIQTAVSYNYMNSNYVSPLFNISELYSAQGDSKSAYYYESGSSTGINEINSLNASVKVYPNPAKESISIDLGANQTGEVNVNIYDITGKLVMQRNSTNFSINELTAGLHTAVVETEQGATKAIKFIVE